MAEEVEYPKILAVIPAYNSAEYVEKAIGSLIQQDYPLLRKLVIDDYSTDDTYKVITRYQGKIEILRNEQNSGFAYSLNRALSLAGDEEFLFVLEDDIELADFDYITRALKHFEDKRVALVCGQAVDFSPQRLPLVKRAFARYLNADYQDEGVKKISYSLLKADLIRMAALREIGGFGFAGNPKLGVEDQVLAKKLRAKGFTLLKDASLKYRLDFARKNTLSGFLKSEANAGRTLGVAVTQRVIAINPVDTAETRHKSNYRRTQVVTVALFCASLLLFIYSYKLALAVIIGILALKFSNYLRKSRSFKGWGKLYFAAVGVVNDFVFSFAFYLGVISGLKNKLGL
jgi:glycosyltransferase involved in cell wall biosynthesis